MLSKALLAPIACAGLVACSAGTPADPCDVASYSVRAGRRTFSLPTYFEVVGSVKGHPGVTEFVALSPAKDRRCVEQFSYAKIMIGEAGMPESAIPTPFQRVAKEVTQQLIGDVRLTQWATTIREGEEPIWSTVLTFRDGEVVVMSNFRPIATRIATELASATSGSFDSTVTPKSRGTSTTGAGDDGADISRLSLPAASTEFRALIDAGVLAPAFSNGAPNGYVLGREPEAESIWSMIGLHRGDRIVAVNQVDEGHEGQGSNANDDNAALLQAIAQGGRLEFRWEDQAGRPHTATVDLATAGR